MTNKCLYECEVHSSIVEWHHPIEGKDAGLYLCQLHHSLIQGRIKRDPREKIVNKTVDEMRTEVKALEISEIVRQGYDPKEINKH